MHFALLHLEFAYGTKRAPIRARTIFRPLDSEQLLPCNAGFVGEPRCARLGTLKMTHEFDANVRGPHWPSEDTKTNNRIV